MHKAEHAAQGSAGTVSEAAIAFKVVSGVLTGGFGKCGDDRAGNKESTLAADLIDVAGVGDGSKPPAGGVSSCRGT